MLYVNDRKMSAQRKTTLFIILSFFALGVLISIFLSRLDRKKKAAFEGSETGVMQDKEPQRIICATPGIAEIVFTLGCGDKVIGVSQFSTYPPQVKNKAVIGGVIDSNHEKILAMEPDLFLTQGEHQSMAAFCREHGIRFLSVKIETLEDIPNAVLFLGKTLSVQDKAVALASSIREDLAAVRKKLKRRKKRTVFLSLSHTPGDWTGIMTTGKGTFLNELIEIAGGVNIFADAPGRYPQISKEALIKRHPEIIIEISALSSGQQRLLKKDWEQLSVLEAVKNHRMFFLTDDYLLIPGVRIARSAERFARIIHPEAFHE